ncbi:MAG: hypothetical protein IGR93_06175 [Hydrococcus sp. C42_A2020_068]|nr:hypothetical protein [Hydrococcus sp. C42_A2020_068]
MRRNISILMSKSLNSDCKVKILFHLELTDALL